MEYFNYLYFHAILVIVAAISYIIGSINPAIIMSKILYKEDIREKGSGNPGFTNFKRVYGNKFTTWLVLILDWLKTLVPVMVTGIIFNINFNLYQFGCQFAGLFVMLGHCFPIFYKFKGGKAFIAGAATLFFVDYRAGLIMICIFMLILFTARFMSLASTISAFLSPIVIALFNIPNFINTDTLAITVLTTLLSMVASTLIILRHIPNFIKLAHHEESKFYLKKKA